MATLEQNFAGILRHLLEAFERRDSREIARIHSLISDSEPPKKLASAGRRNEPSASGDSLAATFSRFSTRDELAGYIRETYATRNDVEMVARTLRLPVLKSDNVEALVEKIIDSTLGYRLRSNAIRGDSEAD